MSQGKVIINTVTALQTALAGGQTAYTILPAPVSTPVGKSISFTGLSWFLSASADTTCYWADTTGTPLSGNMVIKALNGLTSVPYALDGWWDSSINAGLYLVTLSGGGNLTGNLCYKQNGGGG